MNKREFEKELAKAMARVIREISKSAAHGKIGAAMASEGYAGGYVQCLYDVNAILRGVSPSDPRGYWRETADD